MPAEIYFAVERHGMDAQGPGSADDQVKARIPVAVVDDHPLVRIGLRDVLESGGEYSVMLEAGDGAELLRALRAGAEPALVVVDLQMPVMDGFATLEALRTEFPGLHAVAISFQVDETSVLRAYRSGARALVPKGMGAGELLPILRTVLEGGIHMTEHAQRIMLENPDGLTSLERERAQILVKLTPRMVDVLRCMARPDDPTYEQIAKELNISRRTVEGHVSDMFEVFNVRSKTALVVNAVRLGVVGI